MSDPPHHESATGRYKDNPTANEISKIAETANRYAGNRESNDTKTNEHNGQVYWWTRAGTVGAWVYTAVTAIILIVSLCGLQEARRATHAASRAATAAEESVALSKQNFIVEQRPILWFTNDIGSPEWDAKHSRVGWTYKYTNYGKTPSLNGRFDDKVIFLGEPFPDFSDITQLQRTSAPIPPSKINIHTAGSETQISRDEFARLMVTDGGIMAVGAFAYDDAYGNTYKMLFCLSHLGSGAVQYRPASEHCRNEIK